MRGICKASVVLVSLVLATAACGDDSSESSDTTAASDQSESSDTTAAADQEGSTYVTHAFSEPFEVTAPALLPTEPSIDEPNFVTWESTASGGPAVRFLVPVNVFPPGSTDTTPPPDDYLAYLLAQAEHGAHFADQTDTTIGGRPATLLTATVDESLDGSVGCPEQDMAAGDCFGLQPENTLRMAVIDVGDRTLLAWLRHDNRTDTDAAAEFASFEEMLASVSFRDEGAATTVAATAASPIDGVWTNTITEAALQGSPLLYEADEVNDENWGDLTFTFENGRFTLEQTNPRTTSSYSGTFEVDGDVLSMTMEGVEHFEMRWSIDGDQLTLTRDDALGMSPTPWVMAPWTRAG